MHCFVTICWFTKFSINQNEITSSLYYRFVTYTSFLMTNFLKVILSALFDCSCFVLLIIGNDLTELSFLSFFSDVKYGKHTMETCFHNGIVRFILFICEIEVTWSNLPLNVNSRNFGQLFFFTIVAKQMITEKFIINDWKLGSKDETEM